MEFRVPYFVGPLNSSSSFAWLKRKAEGRILPWNIKDKVDFEASEEEFIKRMLNTCTYLPDCQVLPKQSLLYQKFEVLNAINVIVKSALKTEPNIAPVSVSTPLGKSMAILIPERELILSIS